MISLFTQRVGVALVSLALFAACSRPVAYFQRSPLDPALTHHPQTISVTTPESAVTTPGELVRPLGETLPPSAAYASLADKPVTHERVTQRANQMAGRLGSTSAATTSPAAIRAPRTMNGVQRLILKKLNKQISHQLAPNHPEKALVKTGKLVGSLILLIGGLLLLILGSGTVAFIGLIVSLVGGVGVVISLFGIDSY